MMVERMLMLQLVAIFVVVGNAVNGYELLIRVQPKPIQMKRELKLIANVVPPLINPRYEWFYENAIIGQGPVFTIPSFEKKHMGVYTVKVTGSNSQSRAPEVMSKPIAIELLRTMDASVELDVAPGPTITVHDGDRKELHCEVPTGLNPKVYGKDVTWFMNDREITGSLQSELKLQIVAMKSVSILSLLNINIKNEGVHRCSIPGYGSKQAYIVVIKKKPTFEMNPGFQESDVGEMSEFHCKIENMVVALEDILWDFETRSGEKNPVVFSDKKWTKLPKMANTNTFFIQLPYTTLADDGYYYCRLPTGIQAKGELLVRGGTPPFVDYEIIVTPRTVRVRPNVEFKVKCFSQRSDNRQPYADATFVFEDGARCEDKDARYDQNTLDYGTTEMIVAGGLEEKDTNTPVYCKVGEKREMVTIIVEDQCPPGHRRCRNGKCLPSGKFCDGVKDCVDGSDEDTTLCNLCDPLRLKCKDYNGKPSSNKEYQTHWKCDGEDDCGNGFDESQCTGAYAMCGGVNYTCRGNTDRVIPKSFLCDADQDCPAGDDEQKCSKASMIPIPSERRDKSIRNGDRAVLECKATGFPLPIIIWRYNWYCLPDEVRMKVETVYNADCSEVTSRLTIMNFRSGDDGIYNCEAISNQRRVLSDDYTITLAAGSLKH